jgi:hypothetical protein
MVRGSGEVGAGVEVASVANLGLRGAQQEAPLAGKVRRVTVEAGHVGALVRRAQEVAVLRAVLMAGEAVGAYLGGGQAAVGEDLRRVAARLHVRASRPMARLTSQVRVPEIAQVRRLAASRAEVGHGLPVRRLFQIVEVILVAGLAGL